MDKEREIGGFFELELSRHEEFHKNAIALNNGRSCLAYILEVKKPDKIYLPLYSCNSIFETINKAGIQCEFYPIGPKFEPIINGDILQNDYIIVINYYGLMDDFLQKIVKHYPNVIIDNTQAFFSSPMNGIHTYYSPRKFFGVPDGGYLYTDQILEREIPANYTYDKCLHLLKRHDKNANESYLEFLKNENGFINQGIKSMSQLSKALLSSINYSIAKTTRERNFSFLNQHLSQYNKLDFNEKKFNGPMVYPFLIHNKGLNEFLIQNKIYVPTYWKEVLTRVDRNSNEAELVKYLVPLPIDQRYGLQDMMRIINTVKSYIL